MKERTKYIFSRNDIEHLLLQYLVDKNKIDVNPPLSRYKFTDVGSEIHIEDTKDNG